jgi:hypothetical protein
MKQFLVFRTDVSHFIFISENLSYAHKYIKYITVDNIEEVRKFIHNPHIDFSNTCLEYFFIDDNDLSIQLRLQTFDFNEYFILENFEIDSHIRYSLLTNGTYICDEFIKLIGLCEW